MTDALPLAALGVLLVRPGAFVLATPLFGGPFVPPPVRIAITVILAVLMFPAVVLPEMPNYVAITRVVAAEMVIGVALSLAIRVLVAGAELGGHVAGFQIGFSYASLVDPLTGARNNAVSLMYGSLATVAFFGVNGHHALLRALARSYEALPPGAWALDGLSAIAVTRLLGLVFLIGAQLTMPIVIVLLIVEVGLGLASRAAPSLNLMTLGFSLRLAIGLLALAVIIQVVPAAVAHHAPTVLETATRVVWGTR